MKKKAINWSGVLFLGGYHLLLFILLPIFFIYFTPPLGIIIASVALFILCGLAITAGYHRYFSHRSYKTNKFMEYILLFFGTLAVEGSALQWSYEHRLHHAYVDTDEDPYNINKGFWYAHFLWLINPPKKPEKKLVGDLLRNKAVVFQHKYYGLLMILTNALVIVGLGLLFKSLFAAFVLCGLLRMFSLHHATWFINSLAHVWGSKTYSKEHSAVDNYAISLLTFGEGYHNYHHTFAHDYRNGTKWYHFDPTKWLIWGLSKVGLAKGLKKMNDFVVQKKLIAHDKELLLSKIKTSVFSNYQNLEEKVVLYYDRLSDSLTKLNQACKEKTSKVKELKKQVQLDWKSYIKLSKSILYNKIPKKA